MTYLLSSILLSTSSNVDNLAVAIAYGVKKLKIDTLSNILIALVSAIGTMLSLSVGAVIGRYLPPEVANLLGSGVLIAIGILGIWDTLEREKKKNRKEARQMRMTRSLAAAGIHRSDYSQTALLVEDSLARPAVLLDDIAYEGFLENPEKADTDRSGHIDFKESIAIAFSLTINNLGSGVGAGISGLNVIFTTALTFFFSFLAIMSGYFLGDRRILKLTGAWAGVLSGCSMMLLGIYEYFIP
ncbi:MAG: sporulation membrane protein YtaF [Cyanobacteria bacterium CAN_BIN43]|nr:sporulation membrane protein YtaF [Cyanobacteria bacterium CAN_BIN43]